MGREILFRGKETFNGEWVEGYYEFGYDAETEEPAHYMWVLNHTEKYGDMFMVIPETVGQYTGLTDKNDKKIFEGDIIYMGLLPFVVKYDLEYARYMLYTSGDSKRDGFNAFTMETHEVIGNIHDNPELLKGW